jgi:hypothetical protein
VHPIVKIRPSLLLLLLHDNWLKITIESTGQPFASQAQQESSSKNITRGCSNLIIVVAVGKALPLKHWRLS